MMTIVPEGQSHLGAMAYRGIRPENSPSPARRGHTGLVVAGSVIAGLVAALVLVLGPFAGAQEDVISGRILLAFASGWALLAVLSLRTMHVVLADEQATVRSAPRLLLTHSPALLRCSLIHPSGR